MESPKSHMLFIVKRIAIVILLAGALAAALPAQARLVEEKRWLGVKVLDGHGHEVSRQIMVTVFYDGDSPSPRPVVILNHGRAAKAADRAALGRAQYSDASKWLTQLGFIVAVPTRIGYGVTAGPDVEDSGACGSKHYPPAYAAAAAADRCKCWSTSGPGARRTRSAPSSWANRSAERPRSPWRP